MAMDEHMKTFGIGIIEPWEEWRPQNSLLS